MRTHFSLLGSVLSIALARFAPQDLTHVETRKPAVAITVNDGPEGRITPMMLRLLRERGAHATFFVNGDAVKDDPQMLLEIRDAGCEIANHAYSHHRLTKRSYREVLSELRQTNGLIADVTAGPSPYVRPPYGAVDGTVRRAARSAGERIILWNVGDRDEGMRVAPLRLRPGDIVSVRDDAQGLVRLRQVLDLLAQEHLRPVSVGELYALR